MMIADGARAYVGSINLSDQLDAARAGARHLLRRMRAAITAFSNAFESDWKFAMPPPHDTDGVCGKGGGQAQTVLPIAW